MIAREVLRYLLAGGVNTVVSYGLYLALLRVLDYRTAYVLAFVAGIALSFVLLRHMVFALLVCLCRGQSRPATGAGPGRGRGLGGLAARPGMAGAAGRGAGVRAGHLCPAALDLHPACRALTRCVREHKSGCCAPAWPCRC